MPPQNWPIGCPERHISYDGSFCLGVGPANTPSNVLEAGQWWNNLHKFVLGQVNAEEVGVWPDVRALHHGNAYIHQLEMERLAKGTVFENDVRDALEYRVGWLTGDILRLTKLGNAMVNLRDPSLVSCRKRKQIILRRSCPSKNIVFELVKLERMRRNAEKDFWKSFSGKTCCGTMRECPLRCN